MRSVSLSLVYLLFSLACASPRSRPDLHSVGGILPIVPLPSEAESRANERPPSKPWCNITHESEGAKKANKAWLCKSIGRTAGCSVRERHGALQRVSFSAVFHAGTRVDGRSILCYDISPGNKDESGHCTMGAIAFAARQSTKEGFTTGPARAEMSASFAGKEASRGILANNEPPMSIVYPVNSWLASGTLRAAHAHVNTALRQVTT
ncbi:hypothetical protein CI102_2767 [Trichoderma harzianum]|nr:hypothetical protein CI102_2767 [Trichoderma harzianum]